MNDSETNPATCQFENTFSTPILHNLSVSSLSSCILLCSAALLLCCFWLNEIDSRLMWLVFTIFAILLLELFSSAVSWLADNKWGNILCYGWIMLVIIGGALYAIYFRDDLLTEDISFSVSLCLTGYLSLRLGVRSSGFLTFLNQTILLIKFLFPLSRPARTQNQIFCVLISISFAAGMLSFFIYFNNFPVFTPNPALSRYLYFNGPYTMGLTRFCYRIFLSGTEISAAILMYITVLNNPPPYRLLRFIIILIMLLCIAIIFINASRGPLFRLVIFSVLVGSKKITTYRQTVKLLIIMVFIVSLLFFYSIHRSEGDTDFQSLGSVLYPFVPEISEGTLVLSKFHGYSEPFLYGRSFLAGLLTFVPSSLLPFRQQYEINRYNLELAGIRNETSGGIRLTMMLEAYINFGVPGSVIISFTIGYLLGKAFSAFKKYPGQEPFGSIFFSTFLISFAIMGSGIIYLLYAAVGIQITEKVLSHLLQISG
ncbi:MAG: oligosaccharide repeat unit polymerase [Desulfobacteraceae bacterium]|nr:oligosaccharide repeat unit polymerase [Desulfobacteraceae bacterium]